MRDDREEVGCAIDFCAAVVHGGRTIIYTVCFSFVRLG